MVQICHEILANILQLLWLNLNLANFPLEISEWKTLSLLFILLNSQFLESERPEFHASQRKELGIMQQQKQKRGLQPGGCSSQRMRKVRLALAEPFRRVSFVCACLCGVLAAAQPLCMAAPRQQKGSCKMPDLSGAKGIRQMWVNRSSAVLGRLRRDETQVAISKMQHGVPDTATELAMAGQCLV